MERCHWANTKNSKYIEYHDKEWGILNHDEHYLFEMFILECFQAGLAWEIILNKREAFRKEYDNFDINKVISYDEDKIESMINNKEIIRHRKKIEASINNARIFKSIEEEYGSFDHYLISFYHNNVIYENDKTTNELSDYISKDLKKRGMKFVGSVTIYSYLQAVGIINSHEDQCFLCKK